MKTIHLFTTAKRFWLLWALLIGVSINAPAQTIIEKASNLLKQGTDATKQVTDLVSTTKKSTEEFNQSVNVVKEGVGLITPLSSDQLTKPKFKRGKFTNFDWQPVAQFEKQLFPAMIIAMTTYKGDIDDPMMNAVKSSALGFSFVAEKDYIPIRWEIECPDKTYFNKVSGDFTMQQAKQNYCLMPNIPWNMATLSQQTGSKPLTLIYRLYDAAGNKEERVETVFLHSINDCIYKYQQKSFDFLFAAFVQEKHMDAAKIAREAAKTKFSPVLSGYSSEELQTIGKVCAVWKVLHNLGFQFSDSPAANATGNIASQQVHTFANALAAGEGSSFDGAVVFASVLKAMGLSTVMLVSHDHCLVGFYAGRKLVVLETTMFTDSDKIDAAKTAKQKTDAYTAHFLDAVKVGAKEYSDKATNGIREVEVNKCRNMVQALPFN
jgi:hypothetical protein